MHKKNHWHLQQEMCVLQQHVVPVGGSRVVQFLGVDSGQTLSMAAVQSILKDVSFSFY